ncbi:MAG TPA: plastocyanin/azurin family copper-binding protein [Longimicrobium sp.]|nr:plastocyanin/azurin family copper-binding protein [Longimicrobium sp.]
MSSFKRNFLALPVLGMLAFAAACGGGDEGAQSGGEAAGGTETAAPAPAAGAETAPAAQGTVHEVKMVTTQNGASGVFEPANLTVKKGDTIRWTTDGLAPHNVSFPPAENAGAANLPPAGTYLTTAGQTYEITVGMDAGTYTYQCDPHAPMGMKATLTVQ